MRFLIIFNIMIVNALLTIFCMCWLFQHDHIILGIISALVGTNFAVLLPFKGLRR